MKQIVLLVLLTLTLAAATLFADKPLVRRHTRFFGRQGALIDCKYCHVVAGNPRKGKNYEKFKLGPFCAIKACHLRSAASR